MFNLSTLNVSLSSLVVARRLVLGSAAPVQADGNVRAMGGPKYLESDDWGSMDHQAAFGVLFDIKPTQWPVSLVTDLFVSGADTDSDDLSRKRGSTVEHYVGIRKTWSQAGFTFVYNW